MEDPEKLIKMSRVIHIVGNHCHITDFNRRRGGEIGEGSDIVTFLQFL